jgi:hypothetical protein
MIWLPEPREAGFGRRRSNMAETARDPIPFRPYESGTQPPYDAPAYGSTRNRHPQENLVRLPHTITEISGPRFTAPQFPPIPDLSVVNGKSALGKRIIVRGRITDEDGGSGRSREMRNNGARRSPWCVGLSNSISPILF